VTASRPCDDLSFSPISRFVCNLFQWAAIASPLHWLRRWWPALKPPSQRTEAEDQSLEYHAKRSRAVEGYVALWLAVEILLVLVVLNVALGRTARAALWLLLVIRIADILQAVVNASLFDPLRHVAYRRKAFVRSAILAFLNFVELTVCFGILYAADYRRLANAGRPITGFYLSVITQLTIGYGDVYPTGYLRGVAATQGLIALAFVVLVFAQLVASLGLRAEVFRSRPGGAAEQ
jgi:hypothetical protein